MARKPYRKRAKSTPLKELIHDTAVNSAQPKTRVDSVIEHFLSSIAVCLRKGSRATAKNFGYFALKDTRIPGRKTVIFVAQKRLENYVSEPYRNTNASVNHPKPPKKRRIWKDVTGKPVRVYREYPLTIPWAVHEEAYAAYCAKFGPGRKIDGIARAGGFTRAELDIYRPGWETARHVEELPSQPAE